MDADRLNKNFATVEDPRFKPFVEIPLYDILVLVTCAALCGLERICQIVEYGKEIRSSESEYAERKIRIVTAFVTETGVTLGQRTISEKTNEIPVLRGLSDVFNIKGRITTADALHCQRDTVEKIVSLGGNYVIGLKGNQSALHDEIREYLDCTFGEDAGEIDSLDANIALNAFRKFSLAAHRAAEKRRASKTPLSAKRCMLQCLIDDDWLCALICNSLLLPVN
jgi:hypothetical protein